MKPVLSCPVNSRAEGRRRCDYPRKPSLRSVVKSRVINVRYERGVFLPEQNLWLDPGMRSRSPLFRTRTAITSPPHDEIIVSERTARLMQARLPGERNEHILPFGEIDDRARISISCSCRPATFSARLNFSCETRRGSLLYTGDFKLRHGKSAEPAEWRQADTLIMETTYGLPRYRFPPTEQVMQQIVAFCRETLEEGAVPVLLGYSLGKAQEILCALAGAESHADAARLGLSNDADLRAIRPVVLRIRTLQREGGRRQSSDLSAEREPFAHAGKNSAANASP